MTPTLEQLIAHRPPFRFVDRVDACGDDRGSFLLTLATDDPRLQDGVLPPLLVLEGLLQATAAYSGLQGARQPESGMVVQLDNVVLVAAAHAGDTVHLTVSRTHALGPLVRFHAAARVGDRLLVEGELSVARSPRAAQ
ncbi:MAG: hypothetical protein HY903_10915 [Deltaproteobacteria bacterium]|nr:hypothetical protein [Deltaproteobacteria bacterium]